MIKKLPYYYYPTAAIFIDDQESFIQSTLAIVDNLTDCYSFTDPELALKFIKDIQPKSKLFEIKDKSDANPDVLISQRDLAKHLSAFERFQMVTTLVADYAMPKLNGLQLFEAIKNHPCKKIMLTGEVTHNVAIKALNSHVIDRFIFKDDPRVFEELNQALLELKMAFFSEQLPSGTLSHLPECFETEAFADFFLQLFHKLKGVEYYLVNRLGDFLVLDEAGHASWVMVRDEHSHEFTTKLVEKHYLEDPSEDLAFVLERLKSNHYLFAYGFGEIEKHFKEHLIPTNQIKLGNDNCLYATVPFKLDFKIKALKQYKPKHTFT